MVAEIVNYYDWITLQKNKNLKKPPEVRGLSYKIRLDDDYIMPPMPPP
jgi:hypothetical protein